MLEERIFSICNCDSLFSLADELELFVNHLGSTKNKKNDIQDLFQQIGVYNFYAQYDGGLGCRMFDPKTSVIKYLTNYWQSNLSVNESIKILHNIIKRIRTSFMCMEQPPMSAEKTKELFMLVDEKYNFTNHIFEKENVDILRLEATHKEWNSYYSATVIPKREILYDSIMVLSIPFNSITSQEFCFLHELGHLFHTRITKQIEKIPESFDNFLKYILPKSDHISESSKSELFADLFASATLYDTQYEACDSINLNTPVKAALSEYMRALIQTHFPIKEICYA